MSTEGVPDHEHPLLAGTCPAWAAHYLGVAWVKQMCYSLNSLNGGIERSI